MVRGAAANPSAAPTETPGDIQCEVLPDAYDLDEDLVVNKVVANVRFIEFFAGDGGLTAAVRRAGVEVDDPQDLADGGVDFSQEIELEGVKNYLHELHSSGVQLHLHFAPPCSTFSRARDRSWRTRLRSTSRPQGLAGRAAQCRQGNLIARNTLDLLEWAVRALGAVATMENPESSYMWLFLEFADDLPFRDVTFSPCLFGSDMNKPTRVRCWGWFPADLDKKCVMKDGLFTCGRSKENPHVTLEFGSRSTSTAAAYEPGVCEAWAREVAVHSWSRPTVSKALEAASKTDDGRVYRHIWRGMDHMGAKEIREEEDLHSTAGMRNPHALEEGWPQLWDVMADVRKLLLQLRHHLPEFRGLAGCCGSEPAREPPDELAVDQVRRVLSVYLGIPLVEALHTHHASPWKAVLVRELQRKKADTDRALADWLESGAPMGVSCKVEAGGLFPLVEEAPLNTMETLDGMTAKT